MKRFISILIAICMTALMFSSCGGVSEKTDQGTFTLMVYMVGSDLEANQMSASNDINEILDSGLDFSRVNLIIYTGGSPMWYVDVPGDVNAVVTVENDPDGVPQLKTIKQEDELKNMGDPDTLSSFLNYAYKEFPADGYGLICWDHGGGPLRGFGMDLNFDKDSLEIPELKKALEDSPFGSSDKLSFVGFDACLMSSVETAGVLKDYADYMIASQETEPQDGWDYSFLSVMNDSFDALTIADKIIECYNDYYEAKRCVTFNPDLTLACMDLSKTDEVNAAMDDLFRVMTDSLKNGEYYKRTIERSRVKTFGNGAYSSRSSSLDLIDLGSLADECEQSFGSESAALKKALSDFVVTNKTNLENADGVSLYYPYEGTAVYEKLYTDDNRIMPEDSQYYSYFDDYIKSWKADWEQSDSIGDESDYIESSEKTAEALIYTLTPEQKENFKKASLNIFIDNSSIDQNEKAGTEYKLLLYGKPLTPDDNGKITVEANEDVPVVNENIPIMTKYLWDSDGITGYTSVGTYLTPRFGDIETLSKQVSINFSVDNESTELTVSDIGLESDESADITRSSFGKNSIDPTRWEGIQFFTISQKPTRDTDGNLNPYSQWESTSIDGNGVRMTEEMEFSMEPVEDVFSDRTYYYQIVIEDITGKKYLSELEPYNSHIRTQKTKEFTRTTAAGKYTYELSEDEATLIKYEGSDDELIIPEKIEGLPVTKISEDAFKGSAFQPDDYSAAVKPISSLTIGNPDFDLTSADYSGIKKIYLPDGMTEIPENSFNGSLDYLEEVIIPDSVESIGYQAFSSLGHNMKKLELPAGIRFIEDGAFFGRCFTEGVSFKGENEFYKIENDMLLTKDGKTLKAIFPTENTNITIPEGVEEIAPYSHSGGDYKHLDEYGDTVKTDYSLTEISFPSTLKNIRYCAFSNESVKELIFPDSLKEIGNYAFAARDYGFSLDDSLLVETIEFGSKLSWIGYDIIGSAHYGTLKISGKNRFFAVNGNRLTNKHGDADLMDEVALSTDDNLERNKGEYEAYLLATDGLDLNNYKSTAEVSDNKEYLGNDYSLHLIRTKKIDDQYSIDLSSYDLSINAKTLKFPFTYSDLLKTGLTPADEKEANEKVEYMNTIKLVDKDGSELYATVNNIDPETRSSATAPDNCVVSRLRANYLDYKPEIIDFSYGSVNTESTVKDVIAVFGEPSEIEITNYVGNILISIRYEDADTEYSSDCFEINYLYYPESKKQIVSGFTRDMSHAVDHLRSSAGSEPAASDSAVYEAYTMITNLIDPDQFEKGGGTSDAFEYNGKTYSKVLKLIEQGKDKGFTGGDITVNGKRITMPSTYDQLVKEGMEFAASVDPDGTIKSYSSSDVAFDAGNNTSYIATFTNNSKFDKKLKDCPVSEFRIENRALIESGIKADFDYRGITSDTDAAGVIKALGQPTKIKLRENEYNGYVDIALEYGGVGSDALITSIDETRDRFRVTYRYYSKSKKTYLSAVSLYKEE